MPSFEGFGRFIYRVMIPMLCVFAVIMVPSFLASNSNSYYYGSAHIYGSDTQYGQDTEAIESVFGKSDTWVAMVPKDDIARQSELSVCTARDTRSHQHPQLCRYGWPGNTYGVSGREYT